MTGAVDPCQRVNFSGDVAVDVFKDKDVITFKVAKDSVGQRLCNVLSHFGLLARVDAKDSSVYIPTYYRQKLQKLAGAISCENSALSNICATFVIQQVLNTRTQDLTALTTTPKAEKDEKLIALCKTFFHEFGDQFTQTRDTKIDSSSIEKYNFDDCRDILEILQAQDETTAESGYLKGLRKAFGCFMGKHTREILDDKGEKIENSWLQTLQRSTNLERCMQDWNQEGMDNLVGALIRLKKDDWRRDLFIQLLARHKQNKVENTIPKNLLTTINDLLKKSEAGKAILQEVTAAAQFS